MTEGTLRGSVSADDDPSLSRRSSSTLTRTTIREANNHLQMLYTRNQELEQIVNEQKDELHRKDVEYSKLSKASQLLERHCQQLQALLDDRTRRLHVYERKEVLFRETLELKPAIESLLDVLNTFEQVDNASSSIPINTKPLQFVQPSSKKNNVDAVFRTDAV
jgi:predicted nuclease with TOPRIM domain